MTFALQVRKERFSAQANLGPAKVKPLGGGRSQKTLSKVGINELLRGI
ncbi:MAG: hypothetical protein N2Z69_03490 [Methylophilaceae bacterium]|nr:hypothetical protein [Methylophilaceae bacterium]